MGLYEKLRNFKFLDESKGTWTIGKKISLLSGGGIAMILLIGLISIFSLSQINTHTDELLKSSLKKLEFSNYNENQVRQLGYNLVQYSYSSQPEYWTKYQDGLKDLQIQFNTINKNLFTDDGAETEELFKDLNSDFNRFVDLSEKFYTANEEFRSIKASAFDELDLEKRQNLNAGYITLLNELSNLKATHISERVEIPSFEVFSEAQFMSNFTTNYEINEETKPKLTIESQELEPAKAKIQEVLQAHNDLNTNYTQLVTLFDNVLNNSVRLSEASKSDVVNDASSTSKIVSNTELILSFVSLFFITIALFFGFIVGKSITKILKDIIVQLTTGANEVKSSSEQLSDASQDLASSASKQAASIEETSSSLEEMASQIKHTDENSSEAEQAMQAARPMVDRGVEAMSRMNVAMQDIRDSSDETSKIINTIDDIAFQTKLLALNAAVEAARAGEAGKGFAVVAEEVRNLAQRSADAAKNTSTLIQKSQESTLNGSKLAVDVSNSLQKISSEFGNVTTLVVEISTAAKEQADGITQLNSVMTDMDSVVQRNASASEQSAGVAQELTAQADELNQIVKRLANLAGVSSTPKLPNTSNSVKQEQYVANTDQKSSLISKPASISNKEVFEDDLAMKPHELIPFDIDEFQEF